MIDYESQSARALLAIAGRREGIDAARCHLAFAHFSAVARMRRGCQSALARHQLSELQFAILVVLLAAEPEPVSMAVLATHTGVSRSAVTEAVDNLEALQLASRTRDRSDRRIMYVRITVTGGEKADRAINDYLSVATHPDYSLDPDLTATGSFPAVEQRQRRS